MASFSRLEKKYETWHKRPGYVSHPILICVALYVSSELSYPFGTTTIKRSEDGAGLIFQAGSRGGYRKIFEHVRICAISGSC